MLELLLLLTCDYHRVKPFKLCNIALKSLQYDCLLIFVNGKIIQQHMHVLKIVFKEAMRQGGWFS